jgi:hypothetical protein
MRLRNALLAGAALGAMIASATLVEAKPVRHKHTAGPSRETLELREEVNDLKAQLQAVTSRLDAQAQAQQATQAQIQATQAQALAAQSAAEATASKVETAQAQILTIPAQVETAAKKAAPKPGWWNDTKIGATMFADASTITNKSDGVKTPQSGTDFDIKRMYFILDHKFNDTWSFNFTTDFNYDSGPAAATQLYIKKAYLQAKLAPELTVRAGSADLPWIPFVEGLYGYRYVEQTLIDRTKFGTSADWGVHAFGTFGGILSYQFSVIDGEGYKKPAIGTSNRTNAVDVEGRVSATYKHFTAAVGGYDGKLGNAVEGTPTYNTAERFDALAAYTDSKVRLGFEYLWARYWADVKQSNPALRNTTEGYSVFGSYNITRKFGVFGKYEWVKPKETTTPTFDDEYFNVGVSYKPIAPLDFALVYKRDEVKNGLLSTGDGTIGGIAKGTYDEIGLFTQVKF